MHDTRAGQNLKPMCYQLFTLTLTVQKETWKLLLQPKRTKGVGNKNKSGHNVRRPYFWRSIWRIAEDICIVCDTVCLKLIMPLSLTVILIHTLCCKYSGPFKMETVQCTWRFRVVHLLVHRNLKASACVKVKSVLPVHLCTHELVKVCELNLFPKIDLFCHDTMWLESIIARVSLSSFYTFYQTRSFVHNSDQKEHGPDMKGQSSLDL